MGQLDKQLVDLCFFIVVGLLTVRLLSAIFLHT